MKTPLNGSACRLKRKKLSIAPVVYKKKTKSKHKDCNKTTKKDIDKKSETHSDTKRHTDKVKHTVIQKGIETK